MLLSLKRTKSAFTVRRHQTRSVPDQFETEISHPHALTAASIAMQRAQEGSSTTSTGPYRRQRTIRFSDEISAGLCDITKPIPMLPSRGSEYTTLEDRIVPDKKPIIPSHVVSIDMQAKPEDPSRPTVMLSRQKSEYTTPEDKVVPNKKPVIPSGVVSIDVQAKPEDSSKPTVVLPHHSGERTTPEDRIFPEKKPVIPSPVVSTNRQAKPEGPTKPTVMLPPQNNDLAIPEDGTSTVRTSHPTLRKSKTMFFLRRRNTDQQDAPDLSGGNCQESGNHREERRRKLMSKRSFQLLKGTREHSWTLKRRRSQDIVIPATQDQSLQDLGEQTKPEAAQPIAGPKRLATKARKFSNSIKKGIKRIFRRSPDAVPPRSLSSSAESSDASAPEGSSDGFSASNSRVTSWDDSSAANTIKHRNTSEFKSHFTEQEQGGPCQPGLPLPSIRQHDGYSVFSKPLLTGPNGSVPPSPLDSRRIYSALIRRIDESVTVSQLTSDGSMSDSPSVYSRKTCGNTPPSNGSQAGASHPGSPKPLPECSSVAAGSSHHRESAQFHHEEREIRQVPQESAATEGPDTSATRPPLTELRQFGYIDFSRPFRRTANQSTSAASKVATIPPEISKPPSIPQSRTPSASPTGSPWKMGKGQNGSPPFVLKSLEISKPRSVPGRGTLRISPTGSPYRIDENNSSPELPGISKQPPAPESPSTSDSSNSPSPISAFPSRRRKVGPMAYDSDDTRHLQPIQFNLPHPKGNGNPATNENKRIRRATSRLCRDAAGNVSKLENVHWMISSNRLVDVFLSNRRRQMNSSGDSSDYAFL